MLGSSNPFAVTRNSNTKKTIKVGEKILEVNSNPFSFNPFGKQVTPLKISEAPKEITRRKYHGECLNCGANTDSISITCSECGHKYCKSCADIETGTCNQCTKARVARLSKQDKASRRNKQRINKDDGIEDNDGDRIESDGVGKKIPVFGQSWGASAKEGKK